MLCILRRKLSKDLPDGGNAPLKLIGDASDGLVVSRWKGRQKCKSLALDGKEEHWRLKFSFGARGLKLRTKGRKLNSELLFERLASDFDLKRKFRKKLFPALSTLSPFMESFFYFVV